MRRHSVQNLDPSFACSLTQNILKLENEEVHFPKKSIQLIVLYRIVQCNWLAWFLIHTPAASLMNRENEFRK